MPSSSKAQQRFMAMVMQYKRGKLKGASKAVKSAAKGMSDRTAKEFASTPHKHLPEKTGTNSLADINNGSGKAFLEILQARKSHRGGKK